MFMLFLVWCIISLFYCVLSPALHDISHTSIARYIMLVWKVPLNTNQLTTVICDCVEDMKSLGLSQDGLHVFHSLGIHGEGKSRGQLANPCSPGKWSLEWCVVWVCLYV